jgi:hypothetical protein
MTGCSKTFTKNIILYNNLLLNYFYFVVCINSENSKIFGDELDKLLIFKLSFFKNVLFFEK